MNTNDPGPNVIPVYFRLMKISEYWQLLKQGYEQISLTILIKFLGTWLIFSYII